MLKVIIRSRKYEQTISTRNLKQRVHVQFNPRPGRVEHKNYKALPGVSLNTVNQTQAVKIELLATRRLLIKTMHFHDSSALILWFKNSKKLPRRNLLLPACPSKERPEYTKIQMKKEARERFPFIGCSIYSPVKNYPRLERITPQYLKTIQIAV